MSSLYLNKKSLILRRTGFTLIELMMSIGIMLVITSIVLFNQSSYSESISIANLANDISLSIRQAQIYGVSVKELQTGSGDFTSAYGVDFNISETGSNSSYLFFADRGVSKNGYYDGTWDCPVGGSSECLEKINTSYGNTINQLCLLYSNGTKDCTVKRVDITFLRPSTSATMVFFNAGGGIINAFGVLGAEIDLLSVAATHSVTVYTTGQISVK